MPFFAHVSGEEATPNTISGAQFIKFKEYFDQEIRQIEQRYEGEIRRIEKTHKADIDDLRQEINEKTREIRTMKDNYGTAMKEIIFLKRQVSKITDFRHVPSFVKTKFEDGPVDTHKVIETDDKNQENLNSVQEEIEPKPAEVIKRKAAKHKDEKRQVVLNNKKQTDNKRRQVNVVGSSVVAFSATLTNHLLQANQNQTIIFDDVVTNVGNGYHDSHGIFTVPKPGIYVFSFTIMSAGRYAHAKLVKNGQLLVRANGELYDESSHTVVVELKPNDIISVESNEAKADYHGGKYSSFSGFLLYDYSDVVSGPVVGK